MAVLNLSDADFKKEVLESNLPVVLDFWAPWCGPCKMISPLIAELAEEFNGKIKIAKINIDDNPVVAGQYGVMSIPTLMFFKGGKVIAQVVGALSKSDLKQKIQENL